MLTFKVILILSLLGVLQTIHCEDVDSEVTKFMKFFQVIPDVIDVGPKDFLNVTYKSGVFADRGVELTPTQVASEPKVTWKADGSAYYTLLMTDPDAPSRAEPTAREWHHWLVGNIPGSDISKGQVLTAFVGAAPPKDSGLHRYVLLLFQQPAELTFDETHLSNTTSKGRESFSTKKFIEKYKLGAPIAGNFFQAQYDNYVPEIYKQFSD